MAVKTAFSVLYTTLRKLVRDPQDGGLEGSTPVWSLVEKKQAINNAISDAFPEVTQFYVDETTVTLAEDTFEYTLPTTLVRAQDLYEVWLQPTETTSPWERELYGWHVLETGGVPKLYVDEVWDDGQKLRLVYSGPPAALSADADTTVVPVEFIYPRARAYLYLMASSRPRNKEDMQFYVQQSQTWWAISDQILARLDKGEGRAPIPGNWAEVA